MKRVLSLTLGGLAAALLSFSALAQMGGGGMGGQQGGPGGMMTGQGGGPGMMAGPASKPAMDCAKARNPQRCEARQKAREACQDKVGKERKQCMRDQMKPTAPATKAK